MFLLLIISIPLHWSTNVMPCFDMASIVKKGFSTFRPSWLVSNDASSSTNSSPLPNLIEQDRQKWIRLSGEEEKAKVEKHEADEWSEYLMECTKIVNRSYTGNKSWMVLSTKNINNESKSVLAHYYRTNMPVELKLMQHQNKDNKSDTEILRTGIVKGYSLTQNELRIMLDEYLSDQRSPPRHDHNDHRSPPRQLADQRSPLRRLADQRSPIKGGDLFAIRRHLRAQPFMNLLNDPNKWPMMPGYGTMLKAYGYRSWLYPGPDREPTIEIDKLYQHLDPSQISALSAALNLNRPMVAIHGGPGTGKTMLATEYTRILAQRGHRVAVVCASNESMYAMMELFVGDGQEMFDQFLHYKYDARLAQRLISDQNVREIVQERSLAKLMMEAGGGLGKRYRELSQNGSDEERIESVMELKQRQRALLMSMSPAMLGLIEETGTKFDVVILEQAGLINEHLSWMTILPLAPIVRLFGDYLQLTMPVISEIARQGNFQRSLLERVDVDQEFCQSREVNFHLSTQYRAHPAIQVWSNRVLYGAHRAAIPCPLCNTFNLDQLLVKPYGGDLITSPWLFVDTGKLEGGWEAKMFEPKHGGRSVYNLGEALVVAEHVKRLLKYGITAKQIVYFTPYSAQQNQTNSLLAALNVQRPEQGPLFAHQMGSPCDFQTSEFDVVIYAFTITPADALRTQRDLRTLSHALTRARRQVVLVADREQLLQAMPEPMQALFDTVVQYGRVIGPNDLLPLKSAEDFARIRRKANRMSRAPNYGVDI